MKGNIPPGGGIDPKLRASIERLRQTSEIGEGNYGDPMERYLKVRDAVQLGLANLIGGGLRPGPGVIGGGDGGLPGGGNSSVPPQPEDFHTAPGFGYVLLSWRRPLDLYSYHGYTEVWRHTEDNLAEATLLAQVAPGGMFADYNTAYQQVYYYWIRFVSAWDVIGPWFSPNGVPGQEVTDPTELLERLQGQIRETHLYADLLSRINLIDAPDTGLIDRLTQEIQDRIDAISAEAAARIDAIASLDARITPIEGEVLEHDSAITALESSVTDLETGQSANATALSELITQVTTLDGLLQTQSSQITTLTSSLTSVQNQADANATAIDGLDTRVTQTEDSITVQATQLTNLSAELDSTQDDVTANANAVQALDARVTQNEGDITAQASLATNLQSQIDDATDDIAGISSAQQLLDTRVSQNEDDITSQATAITSLQADVEALDTEGQATAIAALDARVTQNEDDITSISSQITSLESTVSSQGGDITTNASAIASLTTQVEDTEDGLLSLSASLTDLGNELTAAEGSITANSSAISGLTSQVSDIDDTLTSQSSLITSLSNSLDAAEDDILANSSAISSLDSRVTSAEGNITSIAGDITYLTSTITDPSTGLAATATAVDQLEARVEQTEDDITAQATATTQVNARLDNFSGSGVTVEQKLTATANSITGMEGQYTLKIDADGFIAGFGASIESINGEYVSSFIINANQFAMISPSGVQKVVNMAVSGSDLVVTTEGPHGYEEDDDVQFSWVNEEDWLAVTVPVTEVDSGTIFRVPIGGRTTPLTASILGNLKPLTSLTRSGTTATAVFQQPHGLAIGGVVDISRANEEEWLGSHLVTAVPDSTTVQFTVAGTLTTPATASVRVYKISIPFVVEGNKVVIDGAYIKEATINTAHIDYVNVTKIEGLDLAFINGTFGTLTADKILGDVNKLYTTDSATDVTIVPTPVTRPNPVIYKELASLLAPPETQTRVRYPLIFGRAELSGGLVDDLVGIAFFEVEDSPVPDFTFSYAQALWSSIEFGLNATWFSSSAAGQNTVEPPATWLEMTPGRMVRWAVAGGFAWGMITAIDYFTFSGDSGSTGYTRQVSISWIYMTGTSITPTGAFAVFDEENIPIERTLANVMNYSPTLSAYLFRDTPRQLPKEYTVGVSSSEAITCDRIGFDVLMVR